MIDSIQVLSEFLKAKKSGVLVTLVAIRGSAPQIVGAKMLVDKNGLVHGTVGGGKIEAHAIAEAQKIGLPDSKPVLHTWNLQKDIGMSCGGEVSLFFEPLGQQSSWNIVIFGAGHICQELCRVLQSWSCQVSVFDTRQEWIERLVSSDNIESFCRADLPGEVKNISKGSFVLSMTQGHATDLPILVEAMKYADDYKFLGVIGSNLKAKKIKKELLDLGCDGRLVSRLQSPLGLPIGNNTPPEIVISILAQLLAVRDGKVKGEIKV